MVITTDGNVGIGITAPSEQLHVYDGSINCYVKVDNGSDNAAGVRFKNPTSEWYVYNTNAAGGGNLRFWENSGSDINFTPAGKVGIGITAPDANLHVKSSTNTAIARIEGNTAGTAIGELQLEGYRTTGDNGVLGRILVNNHNADIDVAKIEVWKDSSSTHDLGSFYFYTRPTGGSLTSRMVIKHDGKVGIGTDAPIVPLDVVGDMRLLAASSSPATILLHPNNGAAVDKWKIEAAADGSNLSFYSKSTGSMVSTMALTDDGKVGIGGSAGSIYNTAGLEVGNGTDAAQISLYSGTGTRSEITFADGTTTTTRFSGFSLF